MNKYFGVNLAGAEFDGGNPAQYIPGTYSKDYLYPAELAEYQYYIKKGLTLFRLPLRWERIQRTLLGDLSPTDILQIKAALDSAHQAGAKVILDLHNYGQYQTGVNNNQPVLTPVTIANKQNLIDVWQKLVNQFGKHPAIFGYEIMNEPHDLPDQAAGWGQICQAVADAIGALDTAHWILIPGYSWQSTANWQQQSGNLLIKGKNILYSGHTYFDGDASGQYWWGTPDKSNGTGRLQPFIDWLHTNKAQGIVTEYGVPFGPTATTPLKTDWYPILEDFLTTIQNSDVLIGGTAWAGGPWWGDYNLTIEPTNTFTIDRPVMTIYQKFPSSGADQQSPVPPSVPNPTPTPIPTPIAIPTGLDVTALNKIIEDTTAIIAKLRQILNT